MIIRQAMLNRLALLVPVMVLLVCCDLSSSQGGFELGPQPTYFVLAPRKVRPGEVLQVSATCLRLLYSNLTIRVSIRERRGFENYWEHAFAEETFYRPASRIMQIRLPNSLPNRPKDYFLFLEGSVMPRGGLLFFNRTELEYEAKEISVFIQTSKNVYHQNQIVRFRVIPVLPNLLPFHGTLREITVLDPSNTTVRRWLSPVTNSGGLVERDFPLAPQIPEGTWRIRASYGQFEYFKSFNVREYWQPRFDVNVTMPPRLSEFDFGVYGLISANHTSGRPVTGNCSIQLDLRPAKSNLTQPPALRIYREIKYFDGKSDFLFTMGELLSAMKGSSAGSLSNMEVFLTVSVFDWFLLMNVTGRSYSYIYSAKPMFKFFGGKTRPFRPSLPINIMLVVHNPDGSRMSVRSNGFIDLTFFCDNSRQEHVVKNLVIPDTGIVQYTYTPAITSNCLFYRVNALFRESGRSSNKDQYLFRHHSESNSYLQVSLSTAQPRVDKYAVFHIRTNYYSPEIYYQVVAAGNIVYSDKLTMPSNVLSKTFSLAISRDMAPIARLIAFYVRQDGEIVSDALTFFANLTQSTNVAVEFNRGKDLNVDTVEVNGYGEPGSYLSLSAVHYDLFVQGGVQVLRDFHLIDELKSYESHAQQPFEHTWQHKEDHVQRVYLPSPSLGPDANKTMNFSGLLLFTDANYTKVSFAHDCNETIDPQRAYPCYFRPSGTNQAQGSQCYSRLQRCDGNIDCTNGVDELDCPEQPGTEDPSPRNRAELFDHLSRHYDDGGWMWKSIFIKPNGRIDLRFDLPKIDTFWVVGAFTLDKTNGLALQQQPALMSGFRRFFITVETPEVAYWGEQIGVRVAVFNYWDYWTETLVEVKRSDQFEVVKVGWRGAVDSYAPLTWFNNSVHSLVYLEAGQSKYVYFPILPRYSGNTTFTICASSYIGGNCETRSVQVLMNGVTNNYHTPVLFDLTQASELRSNNFFIQVPEIYVEPESRSLRYVPGSQKATMTIVGDIIGPGLNEVLEFGTCETTLNLPAGAAENIFFELNYNIQLLRYQLETKQLRDEVLRKGLDYCNIAIQRAMSYFNRTAGGFQNFRENDVPSVWLNGFALFSLGEAMFNQWEQQIYIEANLVDKITNFLLSRQTQDGQLKGSFVETSAHWDRKFFPEPTDPTASETTKEILRRMPLTALVVIASYNANFRSTSGIRELGEAARNFLSNHYNLVTDPFSLTIVSNALVISGDSRGSEAASKLLQTAKEQKFIYWADEKIPDLRVESNSASTLLIYPKQEFPNDAYATQASAMGLMAVGKYSETSQTNKSKIVEWLNSKRNWNRGFSSTQDTIFAMKALRTVASSDFNRNIYVMDVSMKPTSLPGFNRLVKLRQDNYSTPSYIHIPTESVFGEVTIKAEGSGAALLQLNVAVNVQKKSQLRAPKNAACFQTDDKCKEFPDLRTFDLQCQADYAGRNSSILYIKACTKWQLTSRSNISGMAVIDVKVPTGYIVMNDVLREMRNRNVVSNMRRAIFNYYNNEVSFFFDSISSQTDTCVQFRADRWFPIANQTIEHKCKVYEYYEPNIYNLSKYDTVALFSGHICSVCGSFQCPYCPDFNSASQLLPTLSQLMLLLLPLFSTLLVPFVNCICYEIGLR